eukprot:SAG31_NODE_5995_length_2222_cov_1.270843_1_plen_101_part_00
MVLPYSLDTNDMRFQLSHAGFPTADDFSRYIIDAFDWLHAEAEETGAAKMMSIGLHPRVIGRPGRIKGLHTVLQHMRDKGGVWFATRQQIAEHWLREHSQ